MRLGSRSFLSTLFGVAMTLLGWFGPWEWPGEPALIVLDAAFAGGLLDSPQLQRALVLVVLIVINVGAWAVAAWATAWAVQQIRAAIRGS